MLHLSENAGDFLLSFSVPGSICGANNSFHLTGKCIYIRTTVFVISLKQFFLKSRSSLYAYVSVQHYKFRPITF